MGRQEEILKEVRKLLDELESLGVESKEYELDPPFTRPSIYPLCQKCNNSLPYGTYGMCGWCQQYNRTEL